jgi:hypothetical protein
MKAFNQRCFITDGMESIHEATGQTPVGWNAYYASRIPQQKWNSPNRNWNVTIIQKVNGFSKRSTQEKRPRF